MKRTKTLDWLSILFALLILLVFPAVAYGDENDKEDHEATLAPYFVIEDADPKPIPFL